MKTSATLIYLKEESVGGLFFLFNVNVIGRRVHIAMDYNYMHRGQHYLNPHVSLDILH
jgi:hypothetical protein